MTRPPALPTPVPFPVYGLPGDDHGPRNLVLWNQPDWLWTVTLAHGDEGDAVLVTTIRREPQPPRRDDGWESPPNDLEIAAVDAVTSAVERARLARAVGGELLETELDRIGASGTVLDGWESTTARVDATSIAAHTRLIAGTRVVVLDLPTVIVAVESPAAGTTPPELVDVGNRLGDYPWP